VSTVWHEHVFCARYAWLKIDTGRVLADAPQLDLLHVPGGAGQEALMENEEVLGGSEHKQLELECLFSLHWSFALRAAGLLKGRRATTIWSAIDLLPYFGATVVNERVVVDGNWFFTADVQQALMALWL